MAIYDDAIVAYLGDLPYKQQWLDHRPDSRHGQLVGGAYWDAADPELHRPVMVAETEVSDYATADFGGNLGLPELSMSCWANIAAGNLRSLIYCNTSPIIWNQFPIAWLHVSSNNQLLFRAGSTTLSTSSNVMPVGEWVHVGASRDAFNVATIYLNGLPVSSGTLPLQSCSAVRVMGHSPAYSTAGRIADVAIWGRALAADEFVALANPRYRPLESSRRGFPMSRLVN